MAGACETERSRKAEDVVSTSQAHAGTMTGRLEDAVLLMLAVLLAPLAILLIGAPIALCVRAVIEIVNRFWR